MRAICTEPASIEKSGEVFTCGYGHGGGGHILRRSSRGRRNGGGRLGGGFGCVKGAVAGTVADAAVGEAAVAERAVDGGAVVCVCGAPSR